MQTGAWEKGPSGQTTARALNAWYFTFEFPPYFGGGLSTYMKEIVEAHRVREGGSLVVFALSKSQSGLMASRYLYDNVLVVTINPLRALETEELGWWVNVSRLFERFSDLLMFQIETGLLDLPTPDYIEFPDGFGVGALTIQQKLCANSRFGDVPILVNAHTPTHLIDRMSEIPVYRLPTYWIGKLELQAIAGADLVIGPSGRILEVVGEELARTGAELPRTVVLHNPAQSNEWEFDESAVEFDHFYMASRLAHWKGPENAIRAMEVLWSEGQEIPFLIYGDDTYFEPSDCLYSEYIAKKYARWFERGLIRFMGRVTREQIQDRARTAFAQLHPSHFDNFPYSVVEALAEGRICIAGANGGIKEVLVDGEDGFLVDVDDAEQFADALKKVLAMTPEERAKMVDNGRQTIRSSCDPGAYLARKESIVREMASARVGADEVSTSRREFPFLSPPDPACVFPSGEPGEGPVLTVVIPYFNMGAFIDETLDSLTGSTMSDALQILVVNDGSTDPRSVRRLERLHDDHGLGQEQLRIITIPNGGVANARNIGVEQASTPFVALLDADDLVTPRYHEKAVRILRRYDNVSFVGSWIEDYDQDGRIRNWATWNAEPPIQLVMNQTNCQSLVYKREAFLADGRHDPELKMFLDDWEGVIALLAAGHRGVMIPEPLFRYRIRKGSIFRSRSSLWDVNIQKITLKHAGLYNAWGSEVAAFLNANGPSSYYHIAGKESALQR